VTIWRLREQLLAANQRADRLETHVQGRETECERLRVRFDSLEADIAQLRHKLEVAATAHQAERTQLEERHAATEGRWLVNKAGQSAWRRISSGASTGLVIARSVRVLAVTLAVDRMEKAIDRAVEGHNPDSCAWGPLSASDFFVVVQDVTTWALSNRLNNWPPLNSQ
jgi:hypothetical protein